MKLIMLVVGMLLGSFQVSAAELQIDDTLYGSVDNDGDAAIPSMQAMGPLNQSGDLLNHVNLYSKFIAFEDVMVSLTPFLESQFDTIIIGNTATEGVDSDIIPFQHVRVLNKRDVSQPLFVRTNGAITGINTANLSPIPGVPDLVPISSGKPGGGGIRTYSGVFRVSTVRSKSHLATGKNAPMSYAVYIDGKYSGGRASGLAIHGTPTSNHKKLGLVRASHGCMRTFPVIAKEIYGHVMSKDMWSDELPKFNPYDNFPSEDVMNGTSGTEAGTRTLIIIFNGYANQATEA